MSGKRAPKWKRQGYLSDEEYRAACSATRKTRRAAMAASTARYATGRILNAMWDAADFDKPSVKITKEQLIEQTGYELSTIKKALRELRADGSIKPHKNWQGGRNIPTTWWLKVPGSIASIAEEQIEAMEAKRKREAAWQFLKGKYGPLKAMELMGEEEEPEE